MKINMLNEYFASVFTVEKDLGGCTAGLRQAEKIEYVEFKKEVVLESLNGSAQTRRAKRPVSEL